MDRFPLNSAFMNRYERTVPDEPEDDIQEEMDEEELLECMCPGRWQILMEATGTLDELTDALRAHEAECIECGATRKTVGSDRPTLGTNDLAAGEEVA
jgi:hypothetical protein